MKIKYLFLIIFLAGCVHSNIFKTGRSPAAASKNGVLGTVTEDEAMVFPKVGGSVLLKFVVLADEKGQWNKITFIDPRVFAFHYEYLATLPEFKGYTFKQVEAVSLKPQGRKALLGILSSEMGMREGHWDNKTTYSLTTEEVPDLAVIKTIERSLVRWIKKNTSDTGDLLEIYEELFFKPGPNQEQEVAGRLSDFKKANIDVKFADALEAGTVFTEGWGVGRVALLETAADVEKAIQNSQLGSDVVLVVGSDLRELPPVAAVISAVPLTEASHLVLLAQMYGIPLAYEKDAMKHRRASYGKWAFVQATGESLEFYDGLSSQEVEILRRSRTQNSLQAAVDWTTNQILEVASIQSNQVAAYGGKATQFGLIRRTIPGNTRAKAMGIPVSYYRQFLQTSIVSDGKTLAKALAETLGTLTVQASYMQVDAKMKEVRALMKSATLDPKLVQNIRAELAKNFPGDKVRLKLRSSSNVEDGAEFNGAGLYESEGVCLSGCDKDDFTKGLVKVWSSLYTTRGYWARQRFGVDEGKVGMGLLVHPPYKGEIANGVVRFKMSDEGPVVEILGVPGEELSVTNAEQGGVNERVVVEKQHDGGLYISTYRPLKNTPAGRMLMHTNHYTSLAELMTKLHQAWPHKILNYEIESEWKLVNENNQERIDIKQVRMVPQVKKIKIGSGKYRMLTDNTWSFEGGWGSSAREMPWRVEKLNLAVAPFTDKEFNGKKLVIKNASIQFLGKSYPLSVGVQKFEKEGDYGGNLRIDLSNPNLPLLQLKIYMSKEANSFMTYHSPYIRLSMSMQEPGNRGSVWDTDLSEFSDGRVFSSLEEKPRSFKFKKEACPITIKGTSSKRWLTTDNENRFFDALTISGVLKRPLHLSGYPFTNYYLQQHQGTSDFWFDLYGDPKLTPAEKQELAQKGIRYFEIRGASENLLEVFDSDYNKTPQFSECGGESEEHDYSDGEG